MSEVNNANRVQDIAQQIRGAIAPIHEADATRAAAADDALQASNAATGLREQILASVAALSMRGDWQPGEINLAAAQAASMSNNKDDKSVATFIGECKRAMSPKVRAHVAYLTALRDTVWAAEKAQDKDMPRPCAKAFKRGYHMLLQMFGLCEDGTLLQGASDVIAWAAANDPDLDYAKVSKRLEAIRKTLAGFAGDFPVDGFAQIDEFLANITKDTLKAARATQIAAQELRMYSHKLAAVPTVVADKLAEQKAQISAVPAAPAPAEGAFDTQQMLSEALGLAA
jgi:hypothetical protein